MAAVIQDRLDFAEIADQARGLLWGCWRFRWHACGLAWLLCAAGWTIVFLIPDVHRASARVYVDTQSTLRPLLQGLAVDSDVLIDVNMMARAIMSRPNLERLARDTDLDISAKDEADFESLINHLQASIKLTGDRGNVIQVSYENNDPKKALAVVTALLNSFIEGSLGENRSDSSAAEKFLVEKLQDYEARLNESEAELAEFKRKNVGLMPGEGEDYYVRLQVEITKLQGLNDQLNVARNRRAELQRQVEGEEPVFGLLVPSDDKSQMVTSPQDRQVAQFETQLTELRLKYTETHPDIVAIKRTIEAIQAEKEQKAKAAGPATRAYSPLDLNPVYQQMKIQLFKVDVELAQLQAEYSNQSAVVSGLRRKVDTVPAIEAELKRLTRDYDVTKTQYSELLRRVESARLSEDAEQSKDDITFRVIDPPTVPSLPSGPDRGQLIAGVMVLAILAAAALALGLNLTRPVFYTGKDLERRFGVPVLGTVRLVRDDGAEAAARKGATLVIAAMAGLVVVFGLLQLFGVAPIATEATPGAGSLLTLGL